MDREVRPALDRPLRRAGKVVEELKRKEKADGREEKVSLIRNHDGGAESDRELVVTRTFNAPARLVFEAWNKPICSGSGGCRSRWECPCFPAKWMFVSGAGTVWSSHTGTHRRLSSARTRK